MTLILAVFLTGAAFGQSRMVDHDEISRTVSADSSAWREFIVKDVVDADFFFYADTIANCIIQGSNISGQWEALDTLTTSVADPLQRLELSNLPYYIRFYTQTDGLLTPMKIGWKLKPEKQ